MRDKVRKICQTCGEEYWGKKHSKFCCQGCIVYQLPCKKCGTIFTCRTVTGLHCEACRDKRARHTCKTPPPQPLNYNSALLIVRAIEGKRKQTYSDLAKEMPHTKKEIQDFVEGLKRTGSYEKIKKLLFDRTIEVMPRNGMFTHYRQDRRMGVFG